MKMLKMGDVAADSSCIFFKYFFFFFECQRSAQNGLTKCPPSLANTTFMLSTNNQGDVLIF